MAARLHMPVDAARASMSNSQFLKWCWYLEWEDTDKFNRHDAYLEQIALEIARHRLGKHAKGLELGDMKIKYVRDKPLTPEQEAAQADAQVRASMEAWCGALGVDMPDLED